jgi:hypothetical protein
VEHWENLRFLSLIDIKLDNPSDNADMSNEKGNVYIKIICYIITNYSKENLKTQSL